MGRGSLAIMVRHMEPSFRQQRGDGREGEATPHSLDFYSHGQLVLSEMGRDTPAAPNSVLG